MQIPQNIRQFEDVNALIVASGSKHGRVLLAHDGVIEDVYEHTEEKSIYSDNEGRFMASGDAGVYATGAVHAEQKTQQYTSYVDALVDAIQKVAKTIEIDELYLCAPHQTLARIEEQLPPTLQRKVYGELPANVTQEHTVRILERLTQLETAKHPYTDDVSVVHSSAHLRSAESGKNTLGQHNLDRVLVQAKWLQTPAHT